MELSLDNRRLTAFLLLVALGLVAIGIAAARADARDHGSHHVQVSQATALTATAVDAEPTGSCRALIINRPRRTAARAQVCVNKQHPAGRPAGHPGASPTPPTSKPPVPPTEVGGGLLVGIDGGYTGWSDDEIEERTALGAAVTRHEWDPSEPVDEQDDVVETAAGVIHTRLHALLGGNQLGDPTHYREWVIDFIHRYGPGGDFWDEHPELDESYAITSIELGNEPYFGEMSATEYAGVVRPVLEEIQRLNLPVTVILPSRTYGDDTSWMDTLYRLIPNLNELFDGFAEHPYWYGHDPASSGPAGPFDRIDTTRRRMNEHGANSKPIWITEYGESTADCDEECVSEETQASHLQEMMQAILTRPEWGVTTIFVFQLQDRGTDSSDRELQFGLLRQDGSAKPSYGIVRNLMQQYRG